MALLISDIFFVMLRQGARDPPQSMAFGAPWYLVWTSQIQDAHLNFISSPDALCCSR